MIATDPNVCNGHGQCVQPPGCSCDDGYFGGRCQYFTCDGIASVDTRVCNGHGTCDGPDQCKCDDPKYSLDFCGDPNADNKPGTPGGGTISAGSAMSAHAALVLAVALAAILALSA